MITTVLGWINSPATNNGWLITSNHAVGKGQRFYSKTGGGTNPTLIIDYSTCTTAANNACVTSQAGNTCNDPGGFSTAYTCTCGNPAYTGSGTTSCTDRNGCSPNHCSDGGDVGVAVACHDVAAPGTGYTCTCVSSCNVGNNPCGVGGSCSVVGGGGWTCSCTAGYQSTGGTTPTCSAINACNVAANNACVTSQAGNVCVDEAPPSSTYHCTCGNAAYTGTGTASCTDRNGCSPNHCSDGGDVGVAVACHDVAAPGAGYTCDCDTGFSFNGTTCVSACGVGSNPCGVGGSCTVAGGGGWTCACTAGYVSTGGSTPTCTNLNACTPAANSACVTAEGNTCVDENPPSTTYHCTCGAGYNGTNTNGGDVGPHMKCTDNVAPATGYSCACDTGFTFNGTTCVSDCNGSNNPCGVGGTCSVVGTGGWTCSCTTGYVSSGGVQPTCVDFNACNLAATINCTNFPGNSCVDEAPPSLGYHCTCGHASTVLGTAGGLSACVNKNECVPNECRANGDFATCTDHPAPQTGWDCDCSSALWTLTTNAGGDPTCVDTDECMGGNPCLHGACTNVPNGGGYTCVCDPGYHVVGAATTAPTCVHPDSCDANAAIACVSSEPGNACVDNPPPRVGYTCACTNPAYALSIDGRSCIDKNACAVNHCVDEGDLRALCTDRQAPKAGYDCDCSEGYQSDGTACRDVNECKDGINPCGKGTCSNLQGGYQCNCPSGYRSSGGTHPTCSADGTNYTAKVTQAVGCSMSATPVSTPLPLVLLLLVAVWRVRSREVS